MTGVVGIDEAGLGPVLGPLVHSSVALELPDGAGGCSLWELLAGAVAQRPGGGALAIADSKRLYRGGRGLAALERGVLAALAALGERPCSLRELLHLLAPGVVAEASTYPWYRDLEHRLPVAVDPADIEDSAGRLAERMASVGVRLLGIRSVVVLAREFNRSVGELSNKAALNFAAAARLLAAARRDCRDRELVVHLDRHGGRRRYRELLAGLWPEAGVWIEAESPTSSVYRVEDGDGALRIAFTVGCEERVLPVALASMTSKYLRELFMERLNAFWTARVPGLAPTAGYPADGKRFWRRVEPELAALDLTADWMYRSR